MSDRIEIYPSGDRWRWRRIAGNNRRVSNPGQGYTRKASAKRAAKREAPGLPIVERTE